MGLAAGCGDERFEVPGPDDDAGLPGEGNAAGGGDAGGADAGPGDDAGRPGDTTGGVDAGSPDAAVPDVGPPDTGTLDTGPSDAGPSDAGPSDGGPVDGSADAEADSVPDAEPVDGGADAGAADADPADADPTDPTDAGSEPDVADPPDTTPDADVEPEVPSLPFGGRCDLLTNPGAETGSLAGWTLREGSFLTVRGPTSSRPAPYEGTWSFAAGNSGRSELVQRVDVSSWAELLDAGSQWVTLSAAVRGWSDNDESFLVVRAFDAEGAELAQTTGGPWTTNAWTERTIALEIPAGTRFLETGLRGVRRTGSDNDAYFDAITFCVGSGGPPPVFSAPPYLMWVTDDAVSVRWETAAAATGVVEVESPEGVVLSWVERGAVTTHELRVTGLDPATTYRYRVGSTDGRRSLTWSFRTAPETGDNPPISFVVWGDNQDGPGVFGTLTPRMAGHDPDFAVSVGDVVQNGTRAEYRSQLFAPLTPLGRRAPLLITAGNHEYYRDSTTTLFEEYMSQPGDEHCFGWAYGDLYFMFVDTERSVNPGSPQDRCIREALGTREAVEATFRIAVFHIPPRIEFWFGGRLAFPTSISAPQVREILEPLLASLNVDVAFSGHNHLYAYTPRTAGGTTFFTTGGGGGRIDTNSALWRVGTWPQITVQIHEHHYLHVEVEDAVMTVRAIGTDGRQLDRQVIEAR
jgi:predicted phosphodiesterase